MSVRSKLLAATAIAALAGFSPAAQAVPAIGLVGGSSLFSFDTASPGSGSALTTITGLSGAQLLGIDYRPATGVLYGLGSNSSLYTINTTTGLATFASTLSTSLTAGDFDISFNPTVDRLRIVGTSGQNLRVAVDTGAVTVDGTLAYASNATPQIVGAAYTNQNAGATMTTLYDLDASNATLVTQAPPNNGTLNTVGPLGVTGIVSFDIDATTGTAYAASGSALYQVNLTTGAATSIGSFGRTLTDFALAPASTAVPEPMSLALLGAGIAGIALTRRARKAAASA